MRARATSGAQYAEGNCLGSVRDAYGSPATGGSAATAFAATKSRGGVYDTPPLGALLWWTGGTHGYGHVGISNGEGYVWNTDFGPNGYVGDGRIRLIPIAAVNKYSNPNAPLKYVGWSADLDGQGVLMLTADDKKFISSAIVEAIAAAMWGLNIAAPGGVLNLPDTGSWATAVKSDNIKAVLDRLAAQAASASGSAAVSVDAQAIATAVANELQKRLVS